MIMNYGLSKVLLAPFVSHCCCWYVDKNLEQIWFCDDKNQLVPNRGYETSNKEIPNAHVSSVEESIQ